MLVGSRDLKSTRPMAIICIHIFKGSCPQMTGLGIGMQITQQSCTFDSMCLCQGHPVTVSVLLYGLGYIPFSIVCECD